MNYCGDHKDRTGKPHTSKQTGLPCRKRLQPWEVACPFHGGAIPKTKAAAERRKKEYEATKALEEYKGELRLAGGRMPINPTEALLWMVESTAQNVAFYEDQISLIRREEIVQTGMFGEYLSTWVKLYNEEKDRLFKYSADCLRIGLEAKRVEIVEEQGKAFMDIQVAGWDAIGLSGEQRQLAAKAMKRKMLDLRLIGAA